MRSLDSHVLVEALTMYMRSFVFLFLGLFGSESNILKFLDFRVEVGLICRSPDILKSGIPYVVLDIVAYGLIEKCRLLADDSKRTSKVMDVVIFYIDAVDQYLPACYIIKTL